MLREEACCGRLAYFDILCKIWNLSLHQLGMVIAEEAIKMSNGGKYTFIFQHPKHIGVTAPADRLKPAVCTFLWIVHIFLGC